MLYLVMLAETNGACPADLVTKSATCNNCTVGYCLNGDTQLCAPCGQTSGSTIPIATHALAPYLAEFTFPGDYSSLLTSSQDISNFEDTLIATVAAALGLDPSKLSVASVSFGSIVVVLSVHTQDVLQQLKVLVISGALTVSFGDSVLTADPQSFKSVNTYVASTTTSAPAQSASSASSSPVSTGAVVGIVIGATCGVVLVVVLLIVVRQSRNASRSTPLTVLHRETVHMARSSVSESVYSQMIPPKFCMNPTFQEAEEVV